MPASYEVEITASINAPVTQVWDIISDTGRYAEWVGIVDRVTDHHGIARKGQSYTEITRIMGPIRSHVTWTVREAYPQSWRLDSGAGLAPLKDAFTYFKFDESPTSPDGSVTLLTYGLRYSIGWGPIEKLIQPVLSRILKAGFRTSIRNLQRLIHNERRRVAA